MVTTRHRSLRTLCCRCSRRLRTLSIALVRTPFYSWSQATYSAPWPSREQNWVASGSFDRTVKLWDVSRERQEPLVTLHSPEASGPKASVYALATDLYGGVVASGSPERVVRMWDPRTGKRTGKLVGHTDNIRAILISEDAKYVSGGVFVAMWRGLTHGVSYSCSRGLLMVRVVPFFVDGS